jgi:hypothetical protein
VFDHTFKEGSMNRTERRMFDKIMKEDLDLSMPEVRELVAERLLKARRKGGKAPRRKTRRAK